MNHLQLGFWLLLGLAFPVEAADLTFLHLSTTNTALPAPGPSTEQTASVVFDANKDGLLDFVIGARKAGPCLLLYLRTNNGWTKQILDPDLKPIEAGGAVHDIDRDGDLDLVFGADYSANQIWWWENPHPKIDPKVPWARREIKNSGGKKHHDQILGNFDEDPAFELAFWNQGDKALCLAEIPSNPRQSGPWPYTKIYSWTAGAEHEGLAQADVDQDGVADIVGGGRWFKRNAQGGFDPVLIDDNQRFARVAAGQLIGGGGLEIVFVPGDADGPLVWYECFGSPTVPQNWKGHRLAEKVVHGHSLALADLDGDRNLDIFVAEMHTPGHGNEAAMSVYLGNGQGDFRKVEVSRGLGNHESRVADLDGDGDLDILGKPYTWNAPRLDIWLNQRGSP